MNYYWIVNITLHSYNVSFKTILYDTDTQKHNLLGRGYDKAFYHSSQL